MFDNICALFISDEVNEVLVTNVGAVYAVSWSRDNTGGHSGPDHRTLLTFL